MRKWKSRRPKFQGRAAFKTLLRRNGFSVPRDFYGFSSCMARKGSRAYRFRFTAGVVDISCPWPEFDRWANSTEETISIEELKVRLA
jgi:hypothetical protein